MTADGTADLYMDGCLVSLRMQEGVPLLPESNVLKRVFLVAEARLQLRRYQCCIRRETARKRERCRNDKRDSWRVRAAYR